MQTWDVYHHNNPRTKFIFHCILVSLLAILLSGSLYSQCPPAKNCDVAEFICDLSILDGLVCSTTSKSNLTFPDIYLCDTIGYPHNIGYYSFYGIDDTLEIVLTYDKSQCDQRRGLQAGIIQYDCNYPINSVVCQSYCPADSIIELRFYSEPCIPYYLWVDGCDGDICQYNLSVKHNGVPPPNVRLLGFEITGEPIPCNIIEICAKNSLDCRPPYYWTVDGEPCHDIEDGCLSLQLENYQFHGREIELCAEMTIGNPMHPSSACFIEKKCTTIILQPAPRDTGDLIVICPEDQPFYWHGIPITSTCINRPCSVRIVPSTGPCIDSFRPFLIIPPNPPPTKVDTFICDGGNYRLDSQMVITDEVCSEEINFQSSRGCDTSIILTLRRPKFSIDWNYDSISQQLCASLTKLESCGVVDSTPYNLIWFVDSMPVDTLSDSACFKAIYNGLYEVQVLYIHDSTSCTSKRFPPYILRNGIDKKSMELINMNVLCRGDTIKLGVKGNMDAYYWIDSLTGRTDTGDYYEVWDSGHYCVRGFREIDSCDMTLCTFVRISSIQLIDTIITADHGNSDGSIQVEATSIDTPLVYKWSNGDSSTNITNLSHGTYMLTIENILNCKKSISLEVPLSTNNSGITNDEVAFFPNPGNGRFFCSMSSASRVLDAIDIYGNFHNVTNIGKHEYELRAPSGTYVVRLWVDGDIGYLKLIVQKN